MSRLQADKLAAVFEIWCFFFINTRGLKWGVFWANFSEDSDLGSATFVTFVAYIKNRKFKLLWGLVIINSTLLYLATAF